ncbi:MAG: hypothetical protein AAGI88_13110 [Pseudomonadota bacterium]
MIAVNSAAFLIGSFFSLVLMRPGLTEKATSALAMPFMALVLLLTAFLGQQAYGATRWIALGPLLLQPSFVVLPFMLVSFSIERSYITTTAILIAALALALQPDRGMAGAMVFALAVQAVLAADRLVLTALVGSVAAFVVTLLTPDNLPAMPYVERVLYSSFDVHVIVGITVLCGSALLFVPGLAGYRLAGADRVACISFSGVWFALILASALGNYPTPVVGYSGAAVLGYTLSVSCLPGRTKINNRTRPTKGVG